MRIPTFFRYAVIASLLVGMQISLTAQTVTNGGFESGLSGWTTNGGHVSVQSAPPYLPTEGTKLVAFNAANSSPDGFLSQDVALVIGHRYRLEFDVGNLAYNSQHQRMRVQVSSHFSSVPFAVDDIIDIPGSGGGATAWVAASYEFQPEFSNSVSITFSDVSQATNALDLVLDNVRLTDITNTEALANGGFEYGLAGWVANGNVTTLAGPPYAPTEGTRLAAFNAANSTPDGSLARFITADSGKAYRLQFDVGNLAYNTGHQRLRVLATYAMSYHFAGTLVDDIIDIPGPGGGATKWVAASYDFVGPPNGFVNLQFIDVSTATHSLDLVLDHVRVTPVFKLDVAATASGNAITASIPLIPGDISGQSGGSTPFQRRYLRGTDVTLTAPATSGGLAFQEWRKGGANFSNVPEITVTMTDDTALEAVYGVSTGLALTPYEGFEITGIAGTGPFTPSSKQYVISNPGSIASLWFIANEAHPGVPLADWISFSPGNGYLQPGESVTVTFTVNSLAANQVPGTHETFFKLRTDFGDIPIPLFRLTTASGELMVNGGFESGLTAWIPSGNVSIQSGAPYAPTEGTKLLAFNAGNSTPNANIYQEVAVLPGHRYRLEFDVGNLAYNSLPQRLQMQAGETANGNIPLIPAHSVVDVPAPSAAGGTNWLTRSYEFVVLTNKLTVVLYDISLHTNSVDLVVDRVSLKEVPAPADSMVNGGFENGFNSWTADGNVSVQSAPPYGPTEGTRLAAFNAVDSTPNGSLEQNVEVSAGRRYRLLFDVGNLSYNSQHQKIHVEVTHIIGGDPLLLVSEDIDIPGPGGGATAWVAASYDFTPNAYSVKVRFTDVSQASNSLDLVLDNIRLEPLP